MKKGVVRPGKEASRRTVSSEDLLQAVEALLAPETVRRQWAVDRIRHLDAHRSSPVVAALLARCLTEPDVALRASIARLLAEALPPEYAVGHGLGEVRAWVARMLNEMHQREVYALVQVAHCSREDLPAVCRLLEYCPFAGSTLVRIVANSQADVEIRAAAAELLGCIGYLDAGPMLDELIARLRRRPTTQPAWGPVPGSREVELLLPAAMNARAALEEAEQ